MPSKFRRMVQGLSFRGGGDRYIAQLLALEPLALWPLNELAGATTVQDKSGNGYNATAVDVAWQQPGIEGSNTAAYFNGSSANINIYSAELSAAFTPDECTLFTWMRVPAGAWIDSTTRNMMRLRADGDNDIYLYKLSSNNQFRFFMKSGGTSDDYIHTMSDTVWKMVTMTHSLSGDVQAYYLDGSPLGSDSGLVAWNGSGLSALYTYLGGGVWHGYLQYTTLFNRALTPAEVAALYVPPFS